MRIPMGAFFDALSELCRLHPLREKIVVVPSLAIGHQIGDAVARGGTPWVNLRFETTRTIADAICGHELAAEGTSILSRAQALAILEHACDRVLDGSSYFAALAGKPGLYRALQRSLDDLRHAGLGRSALPPEAFENAGKARDLAAILGAYEQELEERQLIDRFGVTARALAVLDRGAAPPWPEEALWIVLGDLELTSVEERLVQRITRNPERIVIPAVDAPTHLNIVRAVGEENEIRETIRTVLREKLSFDEVEILYSTRDPYLPLAFELTAEYGVPATFAEGVSAGFTRPGQALLGFLRWVGDDFNALHLQDAARAGALRTKGENLTPFAFGKILRAAMIGWGRERYVPRLQAVLARLETDRLQTDSETRIEGIEREMVRVRESLALVRSLLEETEELGRAALDGPTLAGAALRFLDAFAASRSEIDGMALAAIRRLLRELQGLPPAEAPRRVAIDRLAEAMAAIHVSASNPRPGHLHVAPIRSGGWSGRAALFVAGLDDARHPGSGLQDPVVLDDERRRINSALDPLRLDLLGDAPSRTSARLRRLFGRAPDARWTLSYAELDLNDRRARFPSRDLLEVYRSNRGQKAATYEQVAAEAAPAGFLEADVPLSASEWWLAQRFLHGRHELRGEVLAAYPALGEGERARLAREADGLTPWDGRINVPREALDPRYTGRVYSASQMERMAGCPFGWFLERVLKIEPARKLERMQDHWLDNRQFGVLVHEVLQTIMEEICAAQVPPSLEAHLGRMHAIGDEALARWRSEVPPGAESAFVRQREELHAASEIFLRAEERVCGRIEPRFFEAPFGVAKEGSPIAMAEPLRIALRDGREVRLRGFIDRIDQDVTTGDWEVWDYKTGGLFEYHDAWRLRRGTKLQHAIYARALAEMLRARGLPGKVQCSGYYFPTTKGGGDRVARECAPGELERTLDLLFDVIGAGYFPRPDEGSCGFCPYPEICGSKQAAAETMARKQMTNAGDPAVRAWRDLQEVD